MDSHQLYKFNLNNTQEDIIKFRSNTPFRDWNNLITLIPNYPKDLKDFTFF